MANDDALHQANRRLARDLGSVTAQKMKLALWLAEVLRSVGGSVVLHGAPLDLGAVHLLTEHRCGAPTHGPECRTTLELHEGLLEVCENPDCHRMAPSPLDGPGIRTERSVEPRTDPPPSGDAPSRAASFSTQMLASEAWQHPERN